MMTMTRQNDRVLSPYKLDIWKGEHVKNQMNQVVTMNLIYNIAMQITSSSILVDADMAS